MDWRKRQLQGALEDVAFAFERAPVDVEFEGKAYLIVPEEFIRYVGYVCQKTVEWISKSEGENIKLSPDQPEIEAILRKEPDDGKEAQG